MLASRRDFITLAGGTLLKVSRPYSQIGFASQIEAESHSGSNGRDNQSLIDDWIKSWMMNGASRGPGGPLILSRFADPMYFLRQPIGWHPNPDQHGYEAVSVPVGFVTDLASIPRVFWSALRPDGDYIYSAIVHDYLYWIQTCSRPTADTIFQLSMQDFGVKASTIAIIYQAVRRFGGGSWDTNQRLKKAGEKRTLKQFPDDPRVRWLDWKMNPSVFL